MIFLDPTNDMVFKKLFGNSEHKNILISFLNSILEKKEGEKIVDVIINDPNNYPERLELKHSIVDVRCTDQKKNNYIVEMQVAKEHDYAQRCQYYTALAIGRQLQKKEEYKELNPVIFVGILDFDFLKGPHYLSHHFLLEKDTHEHALRHIEFHFIELKKFNKTVEKLINNAEKWIYLLKNADKLNKIPSILKQLPDMQNAFDLLEQGNWSIQELEQYDYYYKILRSQKSQVETGREEGREEKARAIAKNLLIKNKFSFQEISEVTGLTLEEIKNL